MATVRTPSGTRIYMAAAAAGTKQSITAISKANPGVLTYSGTDNFTIGTYAAITDVFGMTELEDALVKVGTVDTGANTFVLEDQDTSGYGTFSAGNVAPVTLDTEINSATGFTISGGEQQFAEYTYLWDKITRRMPTTKSGMTIEIPSIWDPADAASQAVLSASDKSEKRAFKIVLPDGLEMMFFGYIASSGLPQVQDINSVMQTTFTISAASRVRYILP
jgi:hypothetical protein